MQIGYNPSFGQPAKGKYNPDSAFIALKGGSDAYLLENELSELQWIQVQERAKVLKQLFGHGTIPTYTKAQELLSISATNKIQIKEAIYLIAGHYFYVPTTIIDLETASHNNYDVIYIDFAFKEITTEDTVLKNGSTNKTETVPNTMKDERINVKTSHRIQKQSYVNCVKNQAKGNDVFKNPNIITCNFTATEYTKVEDNILKIETPSSYISLTDDNCIVGFPIAYVKRTANKNITDDDIELIAKNVQSILNEEFADTTNNQLHNLTDLVKNLQNSVTELDVRRSFYEKYGLYMNAPTYMYLGDGAKLETTITGYDLKDGDDFVFQLSSMGNNYAAQIGEIWSQSTTLFTSPNITKLNVYNSGKSNVMFILNHFKKTNNEIAWVNTTSAGNSTAKNISLTNGFTVRNAVTNITNWDIRNKCIVCVQPLYASTSTFTTTPSIGDIWIDDSNSSNLVVYNSGASNIPLQIFIIKVDNDNLELTEFNFSGSANIVKDAFGKHYEFIKDTNVRFVMLSTLIKRTNQTTIPDIGEVYVIPGENQYMVSTTSNGTGVYIKALAFKK